METIDAVWRAVEDLSEDLKMALLLRDVVGLSYTEIADSLEVTLATVKWRIYKAREDVQLALAREGITSAETVAETARNHHLRRATRRRRGALPAPRAVREPARGSPPASRSIGYSSRRNEASRAEVEQEPGRARVPVARLADRAGIEEPAARGEVDLGTSRREAAGELASRATIASATWE